MPVEPYLLYTVAVISLGTFQFGYNLVRLYHPPPDSCLPVDWCV